MLSPLVAAAGQTADNDVEERDDAVDDGHADAADAVDDGHEDIADGLADALKLDCLLVLQIDGVEDERTQETTAPMVSGYWKDGLVINCLGNEGLSLRMRYVFDEVVVW